MCFVEIHLGKFFFWEKSEYMWKFIINFIYTLNSLYLARALKWITRDILFWQKKKKTFCGEINSYLTSSAYDII